MVKPVTGSLSWRLTPRNLMATPFKYTTPSSTQIFRRPTFWGMTSSPVESTRSYWLGCSAFHSRGFSSWNTKGSPVEAASPTFSPPGAYRVPVTLQAPLSSSSTVTVAWVKPSLKLSFTK